MNRQVAVPDTNWVSLNCDTCGSTTAWWRCSLSCAHSIPSNHIPHTKTSTTFHIAPVTEKPLLIHIYPSCASNPRLSVHLTPPFTQPCISSPPPPYTFFTQPNRSFVPPFSSSHSSPLPCTHHDTLPLSRLHHPYSTLSSTLFRKILTPCPQKAPNYYPFPFHPTRRSATISSSISTYLLTTKILFLLPPNPRSHHFRMVAHLPHGYQAYCRPTIGSLCLFN